MIATIGAFSEVLLPIVVIVALGYALQRAFPLDVRTLNRVSIYVLSPCLVFVSLLRAEVIGGEALRLGTFMALNVVVMSGCAYLLARAAGLGGAERSGLMLATTFMNSGNYGLPATRFAFGETGFQY